MKAIHWIIAAAALSFVQPAPASAAQGDPEVIIYRGSGVLDTGGGDIVGVGTAFHCTNFSGVNENVRFVIRSQGGAIAANQVLPVPHLNTATALTKVALIYIGVSLNT